MRTLRLSAPSLAAEPGLLRSHLASRLLSHPDPGIAPTADPLASLTPAPSRVTPSRRQAFTGHGGPVRGVAVTPHGAFAVGVGEDASVRLWNLAAGSELARCIARNAPSSG